MVEKICRKQEFAKPKYFRKNQGGVKTVVGSQNEP